MGNFRLDTIIGCCWKIANEQTGISVYYNEGWNSLKMLTDP